jgi:hypothetical protein
MISTRPDCREGVHWRELSPLRGRYRWRFAMGPNQLRVRLDLPLTAKIRFFDHDHNQWAGFDGPEFFVEPEYWSNGNSPKRWISLFGTGKPGWIGTPDCRGDKNGDGSNLPAAFVHDPMRQFQHTEHFPKSVDPDLCFYDINRLSKFKGALPFYSAVRAAAKVWPRGQGGYSKLIES